MMKSILKRGKALIFAAVLAVSIIGCGKGESSKGGSNKQEDQADTKDMVYQAQDFPIEGIKGNISSTYFIKGDKLYFSTYEWIEGDDSGNEEAAEVSGKEPEDKNALEPEEDGLEDTAETTQDDKEKDDGKTEDEADMAQPETASEEGAEEESTEETNTDEEMMEETGTSVERVYCVNLDGSGLEEISVPEKDENSYINGINVSNAGDLLYLYSSYDLKTDKQNFTLIKADKEGKILAKEDINKLLKLNGSEYFYGLYMDANDNIVILYENSLYVFDKEFKMLGEVKNDSFIAGLAASEDGKIYCGTDSEEGAVVKVLDTEKLEWADTYKIDINYFSGSDSLFAGEEYDFYYKDDTGIYGYDTASQKSTKLMDYIASDITSDNTYSIIPFGQGQFIGNDYEGEATKMVLYTKVDPSTIENKKTITLGVLWADDTIKKAVVEFNKNNQEYRIEIKDYSSEEDAVTKMNADIVAGNVPDIMCLSNLPVEQYIEKGMLEDLTPYVEKDAEIKEGDFIPAVLEAMKTDGKLYYVSPSFQVHTMLAAKDLVGEKSGWTFQEMFDLLESQKDDVRPFHTQEKTSMLSSFLWYCNSDFIDWRTGECKFDSQEFKGILELCNKGKNENEVDYENEESEPSAIKSGKVLFTVSSVGLDEIQLYKKMYNRDITFVGLPNAQKEGSYFTFNSGMGIYSKSEMKEGAWEFLRTLMTKDYQGKQASFAYEAPTRQDAFDMMIKARTATENYTDEYGNEVYVYQSGWGWDDLTVEIGPAPKEDVEMYKALIDSTHRVLSSNDALFEIILEEAGAYFAGDKDVNETAEIIQNRVKTYVNENR